MNRRQNLDTGADSTICNGKQTADELRVLKWVKSKIKVWTKHNMSIKKMMIPRNRVVMLHIISNNQITSKNIKVS